MPVLITAQASIWCFDKKQTQTKPKRWTQGSSSQYKCWNSGYLTLALHYNWIHFYFLAVLQ